MNTASKPTTNPLQARILAGVLGLCVLVPMFYMGYSFFASKNGKARAEAVKPNNEEPVRKQPIILLTGFEPFGEKKEPNPSWEGIKGLDGRKWQGYQLVAKQMRVVWGEPLQQLPAWISEYEPVAIFSFGQGGRNAFAIESKASNERSTSKKAKDNLGALPPRPTIVGTGPSLYQASADCERFANILAAKGYPMRVSTKAGRYLCEETLYSLEYLKSTLPLDGSVMFCHIPSLGTHILEKPDSLPVVAASSCGFVGQPLGQGPLLAVSALVGGKTKTVSADYVQQFVMDTLETWHAVRKNEETTVALEQGSDPRIGEVKEMINRYFRTWSNQDMKGYDACFMPDAVIQFIDPQGRISTTPRKQFIAEQTQAHKNSPQRMVEVPESIDVRFEAKLARVIVYWRLTSGPRSDTGYDHFTLMKHEGNWRIVNLVFYPAAKRIPD